MTMATALPFGLRDVKIYPYLDAQGTILADDGFDLPNAQTFSFADTEDFVNLRGDDELKASHGNGAQVNWSLESGGIELPVWAVFTGGQIIEEGTAPNRRITLRKCSDDVRPYFMVVGQVMSDSGGNVIGKVYRAKCNGDISGQFSDGQFFITKADGIGLSIPGTRLVYDIVHEEQKTFLSTTPDKLPILPPKNLTAGNISSTGVTLVWEPVTGATSYTVEKSNNSGSTWTAEATAPTVAKLAVTALTADTEYLFRVKTKIGTDSSYASSPVTVKTLAS